MAKKLVTLSHPDFVTKGAPLTKEEADQDLIEIWEKAEEVLTLTGSYLSTAGGTMFGEVTMSTAQLSFQDVDDNVVASIDDSGSATFYTLDVSSSATITGSLDVIGDISTDGALTVGNTITVNGTQLFNAGGEQTLDTGSSVVFSDVSASNSNSGEWAQAYDDNIVSMSMSPSGTLSIFQRDGDEITTNFFSQDSALFYGSEVVAITTEATFQRNARTDGSGSSYTQKALHMPTASLLLKTYDYFESGSSSYNNINTENEGSKLAWGRGYEVTSLSGFQNGDNAAIGPSGLILSTQDKTSGGFLAFRFATPTNTAIPVPPEYTEATINEHWEFRAGGDGFSLHNIAGISSDVDAFRYFRTRPIADPKIQLFYDNILKFETTGSGAKVFGTTETQNLFVNNGTINLNDEVILTTSATYKGLVEINNVTGSHDAGLVFNHTAVNGTWRLSNQPSASISEFGLYEEDLGDWYFRTTRDGRFEIYDQGNKKFSTRGDGAEITGSLRLTDKLYFDDSSTDIWLDKDPIGKHITIQSEQPSGAVGSHGFMFRNQGVKWALQQGKEYFNLYDPDAGNFFFRAKQNEGWAALYNYGNMKIQTTPSGAKVYGNLEVNSISGSISLEDIEEVSFDNVRLSKSLLDDGILKVEGTDAGSPAGIELNGDTSQQWSLTSFSNFEIKNETSNEVHLRARNTGETDLFFEGSRKLTTKNNGIEVVGTISANTITFNEINASTIVSSSIQEGSVEKVAYKFKRSAITSNYTVSVDDHLLGVDTSTNEVTLTLPSASEGTQSFIIKDEGFNFNNKNLTIQSANPSDTFEDGQSELKLTTKGTSVTIYSNGSDSYYVI